MKKSFGKLPDGRDSSLIDIGNSQGMKAFLTDYGAALVRLYVKDRNRNSRDLVLGYDDVSGYVRGGQSLGGTVGRFANRIGSGTFSLNGHACQLTTNNGPNALHGGRDFYVHRLWDLWDITDTSVTFHLKSPDGDQGFPGNVDILVSYSINEKNELCIDYSAQSDQDTPLNLTNHSYFNLAGHDSGSVLSQLVTIQADYYTETDSNSLPTGRLIPVTGTPLDFSSPKELGRDIEDSSCPALKIGNGYDHNYVIKGEGSGLREAASMECRESGIRMTVYTDLPGLQLYTANHLHDVKGKEKVVYGPRTAACFETQYFPDAVNQPDFPGGVLRKGDLFKSSTIYQFSVNESI